MNRLIIILLIILLIAAIVAVVIKLNKQKNLGERDTYHEDHVSAPTAESGASNGTSEESTIPSAEKSNTNSAEATPDNEVPGTIAEQESRVAADDEQAAPVKESVKAERKNTESVSAEVSTTKTAENEAITDIAAETAVIGGTSAETAAIEGTSAETVVVEDTSAETVAEESTILKRYIDREKQTMVREAIEARLENKQPLHTPNQITAFMKDFKLAYVGYLEALHAANPELTSSDELVLALMASGLSIPQICMLLESKPRTIWSRRLRIKNHIGLTNQDDLDEWVKANFD